MSTKLRSTGRIKTALKQRTKDRWLDAAPLQFGTAGEDRQIVFCKRQDGGIREKPAVEVLDVVCTERVAGRHLTVRAQLAGIKAGASPEAYNVVFADFVVQRQDLEGCYALVNSMLARSVNERKEASSA